MNLKQLRNIGISAHIDSGKTTLSERILYYAGRIHKIEDVRGGGDGATMDYMELEKERGITITSAATTLKWQDHTINLIDTPGHVDFTVEVERSLRVLDGAILVLCAVGGVQSQSITVDRQMKRYHVPRLAFINKMDRTGANPESVVRQLKEKLGCDAVLMQIPIGREEKFEGVIDLVTMKAIYFDGSNGEKVREEAIPAGLQKEAEAARHHMLEALSMYSDKLMEMLLSEEEISEELIHDIVRDGGDRAGIHARVTWARPIATRACSRCWTRSSAICRRRSMRRSRARTRPIQEKIIELEPDPNKPFVGMAFKIVDDEFGQLTFTRIYQGKVEKGGSYFNQRTGKKDRFSRIVKMHADKREEIDSAEAGDIVAIMGIDCASGDTYCSEPKYCTLENIFIAKPVIKMSITPLSRDNADRLTKALQRFRKEDPTFQVMTDEETGETVIAGMGELHLEIYVERIRREYKVEVEVGAPKVSYREVGHEAGRLRLHAQEADGRLRPVRPHRRPDEPDDRRRSGRDRGRADVRRQRRRRPHSEELHSGHRKGLPQHAGQGPGGRLPGRQHEDRAQRRQAPRSRQLGHGVHGLRPELLPRDVPEDEAGRCSSRSC